MNTVYRIVLEDDFNGSGGWRWRIEKGRRGEESPFSVIWDAVEGGTELSVLGAAIVANARLQEIEVKDLGEEGVKVDEN